MGLAKAKFRIETPEWKENNIQTKALERNGCSFESKFRQTQIFWSHSGALSVGSYLYVILIETIPVLGQHKRVSNVKLWLNLCEK